uniref:Adhesion G-protein coupled receptor G2 n=1 Tax=Anabas testudineus TaxID=64144 RepID=A0A7N6A8L7_ANATE
MFRENEDKVMKALFICSAGSSCWHMFAPSVRVKNPGLHVRQLFSLILLVVLLAGKASCDQTSAVSISSLTTAQASVRYILSVTVDVTGEKNESEIKAWLVNVFQTMLDGCVSPNYKTTTATPNITQTTTATTSIMLSNNTTTATTTLESNNITTATTTLESNNTTTATTTLESNNTTTATTTLESNNTTTATTLESNNTTTATTTLESNNTTTATTTLESNNTTTATTTLESNNTTTATTTLESNNTTTATTTLESNNTTTATTTLESNNTTTATTTLESNITTRVTTPTTSKISNATTPITTTTPKTSDAFTATTTTTPKTSDAFTATTTTTPKTNSAFTVKTPTTLQSSSTTRQAPGMTNTRRNTNAASSGKRKRRDVSNEKNGINNDTTTGLFKNIDISCTTNPSIKNTGCSVTLELTQTVPACCILSTLCAANDPSSDIHVVGNKVNRDPPQNTCTSISQEENSCTYIGSANNSCEKSDAAYVAGQTNTSTCGPGNNTNNACNCSAYCSNTDAYYTFQISIQNPDPQLISLVTQSQNCKGSNASCPWSVISSEYKEASITCGNKVQNQQNCSGILHFAKEVPTCLVASGVRAAFQSEARISYDGLVTRAAICGNSNVSNLPAAQFTWVKLKPANFCMEIQTSNNLTCQNGQTLVVQLEEHCDFMLTTTPSLNVTTIQPNTTTSSMNGTSSAANTTASTLKTTTTTSTTGSGQNTTTAESQANALLDLTSDMSKLNSSQVDQLVSQLESLLSAPNVSTALGNTSIHIVSNLLSASPETLAHSSNRIIGIVDTVGQKLVLGNAAQTLLSPSVALAVKPVDGSNFQETLFSISNPSNVQVSGNPRLRRSVTTDSSIPQGSITLPSSLTQNLTSEQQRLASRVQFNFYQKSTVFQDKSLGTRKLNSGILGASVANLSITGLKDNVVIQLRNTEIHLCFLLADQSGGWNPNGCVVQNSTDNETICGCNHLTSFAILLDLSRQSVISPLQSTILTFITYIGCGLSAIFLSVTLLTYLAFEKLRKDIPSKILIQLCTALLLLNLVFLVDAWLALYTDTIGLCISTAWFLHYFLLVSFTWMGLEAVHMYNAIVKVFNNHMSHYMLKFSLAGWGIPMIIVIIVIAIDKNNYGLVSYGKFTDGQSDDFCWLKNDIAFYVAVVAYFCIIFLFNFVMFIVVLVQLCRIKRQNPHNAQYRSTLHNVRSVVGITVLLGLTWGFAFFAWGPVNLPFMYLFAIFNSLQGFFIFVFYCAVKENVKRQWRAYLCCGKMRVADNSDWSRTATQKTTKKSLTDKLKAPKSSQFNSSSSSTSFLVSDSSEQISGISK